MRLLLDTHALLWWLEDNPRLASGARAAIADVSNELLVSPASPWEIAIKVSIGKLRADPAEILATIVRGPFVLLDTTPAHLGTLASLERIHGDPFDRMMIAQAICEGAVMLTDDEVIGRYRVRTMRCR